MATETPAAHRNHRDTVPLMGDLPLTETVASPALGRSIRGWWLCFGVASAALALGVAAVAYTWVTGIGTWGLNRSVGWAYDITNFVFWIGIGHAGTLISAVLLVFRQRWRAGVSRSAEVMTIIAIVCAAVFPIIHLGRPWLFHWVFPLPNSRGPLWINFNSALTWDVFAIATYFTVSSLFLYVGLLPDLATLRDGAQGWRRRLLGRLALGWNGSLRAWARHDSTCTLLAGLATALVVSVHTVVSFDFATSVVPGWHTTIFPPYFVVGAIFSGMAMVLALLIVMRRAMVLEAFITSDQLEALAKILLATSSVLGFVYGIEVLSALRADHAPDLFIHMWRMTGPMAPHFWVMVTCNVLAPQLLWVPAVRRNLLALFVISILALTGMWLERFVIIVGSLQRDFLPSNWVEYQPTRIEVAILIGSAGLFFVCFLLFCRWLPVVSISESRAARAACGGPQGGAP